MDARKYEREKPCDLHRTQSSCILKLGNRRPLSQNVEQLTMDEKDLSPHQFDFNL